MIGGAVLGERLVATFGLQVRWCFMPVSPLVALAVCMHESMLHYSPMSALALHAGSDADHGPQLFGHPRNGYIPGSMLAPGTIWKPLRKTIAKKTSAEGCKAALGKSSFKRTASFASLQTKVSCLHRLSFNGRASARA